jgi:hypothetical protein
MIRQNGEAQHVDAELAGQEGQPPFEPGLAVIVVRSGVRVLATQEATPHAAVDAVDDRDFGRIKDVRTGQASHRDVSQGPTFRSKTGPLGDSVLIITNASIAREKYFSSPSRKLGVPGFARFLRRKLWACHPTDQTASSFVALEGAQTTCRLRTKLDAFAKTRRFSNSTT